MRFFKNISEAANEEHQGAVAFEYIIILVIMAVALFSGFQVLQKQFITKSGDVATFIQNNGQTTLGKTVAPK